MLDVLTSLSDCGHETVGRIKERRISGVSYMCWMDFHNAILCCGFSCTFLLSFYFTATTPRATTPHPYHHGLLRLCIHPGYHAYVVYFYSQVITPELPRLTTHVHRVITPAIVSTLWISFHRLLRHLFLSTYTTTGAPHVATYSTRYRLDRTSGPCVDERQ